MSNAAAGIAPSDISTIEDLRKFVHATLCSKENLVSDQFKMIERELTRAAGIVASNSRFMAPGRCGYRRCGLRIEICFTFMTQAASDI